MASKTIPLTAVSIQSTSPNKAFGEVSSAPVGTPAGNTSRLLLRGAINLLPSNATVTLAEIRGWQTAARTGTRTVIAQQVTSAWSTKTSWTSKPTSTTTGQVSVAKVAPAIDTGWAWSLTTLVQQWLSGAAVNNGVQLISADTANPPISFRGSAAAKLQFVLYVEYLVAGDAPSGMSPSGNVGITKPVLRFQAPSDTVSIQVQVDPAASTVSPTFDSGEVASNVGYFDLSGSSYGGLTSGSTQWRARAKNALGWSDWSAWVTFSYAGYGTFSFTSPGTTSEDPSPPIAGTVSSMTLKGWRAATLDASGVVLEDSGLRTGAVAYGPTKAYVTARVDVYDDVVREVTPGDPGYVRTTRTFTVTPSGAPTSFASPAASNNGVSPVTTVTATRSAIPDEVAVYRRASSDTSMGTLVVRGPGTSYMSGTALTVPDFSAPMNTAWVYDIYAITGGTSWSTKVTTAAVTPTCKGVWIFNTVDGTSVALWGTGDIAEARTEQVNVFQAVTGQAFARRIAGGAKVGEFSGFSFLDAVGTSGAPMAATWLAWQALGVDTLYRLVVGNKNLSVQMWNLDTRQRPENGASQFVEDAVGNWLAVG